MKFGRLTVTSRAGSTKKGQSLWACVCDCGNCQIVAAYNLRNGHTTSCGCVRNEISTKRLKKITTKHGYYNSGTYISWKSMISRCTNIKNKSFSNYGARGISVCERWMCFDNFLHDMGERPRNKTIDRIDNNKGYFKENCRWRTMSEQHVNKRNNRIIYTPDGEMCVSDAARYYGINKSTLLTRINKGLSGQELFIKPIKIRRIE